MTCLVEGWERTLGVVDGRGVPQATVFLGRGSCNVISTHSCIVGLPPYGDELGMDGIFRDCRIGYPTDLSLHLQLMPHQKRMLFHVCCSKPTIMLNL